MAIGLTMLSACGDDSKPTPTPTVSFAAGSTMDKLNKAQKIRIGTKYDQPGFGLTGLDGKPAGFDVEIGKIIAAELGIAADKITWMETQSRIREEVLETDQVDIVVATYTINDARKQRIDFAGPYYVAGQDIMVAAKDNSIKSVTDLNGKRVCSVQGSTSVNNVRQKAPQAQVTEYDVYSKCADDLRNGRVDAVSTDNVILIGLIADSNGAFKLVGNPFTQEPYGIGLKKGDQALRDFVNDVLEKIADNGDWAAAFKKTVGTVVDDVPEPPPVNRY